MVRVKASVSVRLPSGRFPAASYARALADARASLTRDVERAFQATHDPVTGRLWPPRKTNPPNPMLVRTGKLRSSAIAATSTAQIVGNTLVARVPTPDYAVYHMRGTRVMARRRFIGASIATIGSLARRLRAEGVRVLRGRGV